MSQIEVVHAKADLECDNCSRTREHTITLLFDTTDSKFYVRTQCVCYVDTDRYKEDFSVELAG